MSKDLLNEATRALRASEPSNEFEARATRTRVLAGLQQTRVRRRTRLAFLLPIAASFVAVSAWGAASGTATRALHELERLVGVTAGAPSRPSPSSKRALASIPLAPSPPESAPPIATQEPAAEPAAPPVTTALANRPAPTASNRSGPLGGAERPDPTLALYRAAHTAHFVDRDPARALAAWDAYLGAAPNGEFAPEARYNRGLSLVRLGRGKEARRALEPFANGAYGGYREAEARALLEHIEP